MSSLKNSIFFGLFVFTPKFAYVVTICNFEFCYKWRAVRSGRVGGGGGGGGVQPSR